MIRQVSAVVIAAAALGLAPLASAQAATTPAAVSPAVRSIPNPCKSFTAQSADTLLAIARGSHLTEKRTSSKPYPTQTCVAQHAHKRIVVLDTTHYPGRVSGAYSCYRPKKLGSGGELCVSTKKSKSVSLALFHKNGLWFVDGVNLTLPRHGQRLLNFALAQRSRVKA
jgi:hypothetical protein